MKPFLAALLLALLFRRSRRLPCGWLQEFYNEAVIG